MQEHYRVSLRKACRASGRAMSSMQYRSVRPPQEPLRSRIKEFGRWFFADGKFQTADEFVHSLLLRAPRNVAEIPEAIVRDGSARDTVAGSAIWQELQKSPGTLFGVSRGGADLVGVVGFHSGLSTAAPEYAKDIRGRVLVCIGADDPGVPL